MRPTSMQVPPLALLLRQKHDYDFHKKKMQSIMAQGSSHSLHSLAPTSLQPRHLHHFERKHNTRSLEIAKANSKVIQKIRTAKPSYSFREGPTSPSNQVKLRQSVNARSRKVEQERENYRIQHRVKTVSSVLSQEGLMRDYRRSMQIKNRITHFRTEPNNRVVLKASRYLGKTTQKGQLVNEEDILIVGEEGTPVPLPKASLPRINSNMQVQQASRLNKDLIKLKMKRMGGSIASYYKKDEILKHKIANTNKLFKLSRQSRCKAIPQALQSHAPKDKGPEQQDMVFATELCKHTL